MRRSLAPILAFILLTPALSHAWAKRGHAIVCETAATIAAPDGKPLKPYGFDLGYYCNVPDFFWKKPATYKQEAHNHFMDMEIFERGIEAADRAKAFELDRAKFEETYGRKIDEKAGRSLWRIRELDEELARVTEKLKNKTLETPARHALQAEWLVIAGAIGHYVGDLSQPLHVTENYDGQMTDQKGIHEFFELDVVDELHPQLAVDVLRTARAKQQKEKSALAKKTLLDLLKDLTNGSSAKIKEVLATDKKIGRKDRAKAATAYRSLVTERMATGAVALAELYRRRLDFEFDGKRFFDFHAEPKFIEPPKSPTP